LGKAARPVLTIVPTPVACRDIEAKRAIPINNFFIIFS
jgi:hypothetical protein